MAPGLEDLTDRTLRVWLDPGLITGLATYDLDEKTFMSWQYELADLEARLTFLFTHHKDRVVLGWERFIVTSGGPRTSTPKHALEAIAVSRSLAEAHDVPVLKPQPSSARKLGSPVMLTRLGWRKPGKVHANDAAQHLLSDLLRTKPMPVEIRQKLFPGYGPGVTIAP
jgi:hypothetical protein